MGIVLCLFVFIIAMVTLRFSEKCFNATPCHSKRQIKSTLTLYTLVYILEFWYAFYSWWTNTAGEKQNLSAFGVFLIISLVASATNWQKYQQSIRRY
jgi:hypothetical protein